ncbi:MAG: SPOR domain-containing protein [Gammaproteobacteria bacterium]|nr:SPOR domain-containing protein [Gammaproteobacteria bacterium]
MIRLLVYTCGLLLLANLALLLWPDTSRTAPHIYSPQADINPHFVRLNKEIEARYLATAPTRMSEEESVTVVRSGNQGCYRLGPFMHRSNYELAQAVLFNANVDYTKSSRASRQSDVFRVYIGPFQSQAEAVDMRVELKRKQILDHFIREESDDRYIISLGIYTTRDSATDAVAEFAGVIERVKAKQESVVLPDSYWLHFAIDKEDEIKQQLSLMDWGEQSAKLGEHQCQPS